MESRINQCIERHNRGYNCAQSVACTYCDLVGVDEETMFKATEGFGLGMGCMNETCGAISGAVALAGFLNSSGDLEHPTSKGATYKLSKEIAEGFRNMNNATVCRELKGIDTGIVLRSCGDCICDAAKLVEEILFANKF